MKWKKEMDVNEKKEINKCEWKEGNKKGNLYLNEMKKTYECEWK